MDKSKIVVKLDKSEVKEKIAHGDRIDGSRYYLAVDPADGEHKIHWVDGNAQWDPWPKGWLSIPLPALFEDGSSEEWEQAEDICKAGEPEWSQERRDEIEENEGLVAYVEEHYYAEWAENKAEMLEFLAGAFIDACNGDGTDLNRLAPWGEHTCDPDGTPCEPEIIKPPAEFEWA